MAWNPDDEVAAQKAAQTQQNPPPEWSPDAEVAAQKAAQANQPQTQQASQIDGWNKGSKPGEWLAPGVSQEQANIVNAQASNIPEASKTIVVQGHQQPKTLVPLPSDLPGSGISYQSMRDFLGIPFAAAEAGADYLQQLPMPADQQKSYGQLFNEAQQAGKTGIRAINPFTDPLSYIPGFGAESTLGKVATSAIEGPMRTLMDAYLSGNDVTPQEVIGSGVAGGILSGLGSHLQNRSVGYFPGQGPAELRAQRGANSDVLSSEERGNILNELSGLRYGLFPGQKAYSDAASSMVAPAKKSMNQALGVATQNYANRLGTPNEITLTPQGIQDFSRNEAERRLALAANPGSGFATPNVSFSELPQFGSSAKDVAMGFQALPARQAANGGVSIGPGPAPVYAPDESAFAQSLSDLGLGSPEQMQTRFPVGWMAGKAPTMSQEDIASQMPLSPEFTPSLLGSLNARAFTKNVGENALKNREEASMARDATNDFLEKLGYDEALDPNAKSTYSTYKRLLSRLSNTPVRGQPIRFNLGVASPYLFANEISNYSKPVEMMRLGNLFSGIGSRAFVPTQESQPSAEPGK